LRPGGDGVAVRVSEPEEQHDADPNPDSVGEPVRHRNRWRLGDTVPVAVCNGVTVAERQPESVGLPIAPA